MAYYADLSPYEYDEIAPGRVVLNVGWLERGHPFPTGPADARFLDALTRCLLRPVRLFRGLHGCDLCDAWSHDEGFVSAFGRRIRIGNGEVSATHLGVEYAAPTLVVHYVTAHGYRPPSAFVEAVVARAARIGPLTAAEQDEIRALDRTELRRRARATALRLVQRDDLAWAAPWLDAKTPLPREREPRPILEVLGALRVLDLDDERLTSDPSWDEALRERFIDLLELAREIGG